MEEKKYKKWKEVMSPGLERSKQRIESELLKDHTQADDKDRREGMDQEKSREPSKHGEKTYRQKESHPWGIMDFGTRKPRQLDFSYRFEPTDKEEVEMKKKKKAIEQVMEEFVNWKRSANK